MFFKGTMRDEGIDITIQNNPNHFLAPNDWNMVRKARLRQISKEEYKNWYINLFRERWETRREEILDLVKEGKDKKIYLKCFCPTKDKFCHAHTAAAIMNNLIKKYYPDVI